MYKFGAKGVLIFLISSSLFSLVKWSRSEDFHDESLPWIQISSWLDTLHLFGFQKYQEKDNAFWILYASSLANTYNMQFESNDSISSWLNMLHSLHWSARITGKGKRENNKKKIDIYILIMWYRHLLSHWWKWSSKDFYNESHPWIYIYNFHLAWFVLISLISSSLFLLRENEVPRFSH